jgi:MFS family permease
MYGSPKWFDGAGTWLAKIPTPWARDPQVPQSAHSRPATPTSARTPGTPKTPRFLWHSETRSPRFKDNKTLADFDATLPQDEEYAFSPSTTVDDMYKPDEFPSGDHDTPSEFDPPPLYKRHPPEGGANAWRTVVGAFLIQFCTMGYLFTWNVFEDEYAHVWFTDESPIVIRLIICVQLFLVFGLSLVAGKLVDLGWFRIPVGAGSALFALSLFLLSVMPEENFGMAFVFHGLCIGIGIGFTFVPSAIIAMHYFVRRRGLVTGIVLAGGSLGAVVFPALLRNLMAKHGLGGAVRLTAFIITPLLIIGNLVIVKPAREEEPAFPLPRLDLVKYKSEKEYLFLVVATIAGLVAIFFPSFYLQLLGLSLQVNPKSSFNTIIIVSISAVMGRILCGVASDVAGVWNSFLIVSGVTTIMVLSMIGVSGAKGLIAYSIFFGFFAGGWFSLMITTLASLASRMDEIGTRIGLVLTLSSPLFLVAPLLYRIILARSLNWIVPCSIFAVLFVGVTGSVFLGRVFMVRKQMELQRKLWTRWRMIPGVLVI